MRRISSDVRPTARRTSKNQDEIRTGFMAGSLVRRISSHLSTSYVWRTMSAWQIGRYYSGKFPDRASSLPSAAAFCSFRRPAAAVLPVGRSPLSPCTLSTLTISSAAFPDLPPGPSGLFAPPDGRASKGPHNLGSLLRESRNTPVRAAITTIVMPERNSYRPQPTHFCVHCPRPETAVQSAMTSVRPRIRFRSQAPHRSFRSLTPGPSPFSGTKITPASSRARRMASTVRS